MFDMLFSSVPIESEGLVRCWILSVGEFELRGLLPILQTKVHSRRPFSRNGFYSHLERKELVIKKTDKWHFVYYSATSVFYSFMTMPGHSWMYSTTNIWLCNYKLTIWEACTSPYLFPGYGDHYRALCWTIKPHFYWVLKHFPAIKCSF